MRRCEPFKATSAHAIRRSDVVPNGATSVCVLAMVGHLKNVSPTFAQMPDRITNVEFTTVSPTIANTMLVAVVILILIVELSTLSSQLYNYLRTLENQNCFCQLTFL